MENSGDIYVVFRSFKDVWPWSEPLEDENISVLGFTDQNDVLEIVKAEIVGKSYVKLCESPIFTPSVSFGDILKVKLVEQEFSCDGTYPHFFGVSSKNEKNEDKENMELKFLNEIIRCCLVFEPDYGCFTSGSSLPNNLSVVSHGSYKINVSFNNCNTKLLQSYCFKSGAKFYKSNKANIGSVCFSNETKLHDAMYIINKAPDLKHCYITFNPKEYPLIDFEPPDFDE